VASVDLVDGNKTMILGLIWALVYRYQVKTSSDEVSTSDLIIQFVSDVSRIKIANVTGDLTDGVVLTAMIKNMIKKYCQCDLTLDSLESAFEASQNYLQIPALVAAKDVLSGSVDEKVMMLALSVFLQLSISSKEF